MKKTIIISFAFILTGCSVFYPNAYPGAVNGNISQEQISNKNYITPNHSGDEYYYNENTMIKKREILNSNNYNYQQNNNLDNLYSNQYNNNNLYNNNKVQSVYCQNQGMSQLIGGVAGGALGSLFGKGYGKIGTVAAGTILGATVAGVPCY